MATLLENLGKLRVVTDCSGDESYPICNLCDPFHLLENCFGGVAAETTVVVADPTIFTFFGATAGHLYQPAAAVLSVRRDDMGCREHCRVGHVSLPFFDPASFPVGPVVRPEMVGRHEVTVTIRELEQQSSAVWVFSDQGEEWGPQKLSRPEDENVDNGCERQRIDRRHRASQNQERMAMVALTAEPRYAGGVEGG